MKGLKKQRRIQIIVLAGVAMAASFAAFYLAAPSALQYFRSPTEVLAHIPPESEVFRIGGLVEEGSLVRGQGAEVSFRVTDTNAAIPVKFTGVLPDLFGEGQGVVAIGQMVGDVFVVTDPNGVLAKHDETYMPKEVIDALKDQGVYVDPKDAAANAAPATN